MFVVGKKGARVLALGISLMGAALGAHTMAEAASPTICVSQVGGGSTVTLQGKAITPAIRQAAAAAPSGACVAAPQGFVAPAAPAAAALPAASGRPAAAAPAAAVALPAAGGRLGEAAVPAAAAAPTTSGRPVR